MSRGTLDNFLRVATKATCLCVDVTALHDTYDMKCFDLLVIATFLMDFHMGYSY